MIHVKGLCKTFAADSGTVLDNHLLLAWRRRDAGPSSARRVAARPPCFTCWRICLNPSAGTIEIGSTSSASPACTTAIILQNFGLFPWKTVWENVALALKIRKASRDEVTKVTASLLEELGFGALASRYPVQISGGQQQRVAIARALATNSGHPFDGRAVFRAGCHDPGAPAKRPAGHGCRNAA